VAELPAPIPAQLYLTVKEGTQPGEMTVAAAGEVDISTSPALGRTLDAALADATSRLDLDLSEVTFVDASGVSAILVAWSRADREGIRVRLLHPPAFIRRVLDLTGVTSVCEVID
jgi:anti-sigma B factor antagonist